MSGPFDTGVAAVVLAAASAGLAQAQVLPAPALDAPKAPLAGPPPNQPPRQLPPEPDASSDPAVTSARVKPPSLGRAKTPLQPSGPARPGVGSPPQ